MIKSTIPVGHSESLQEKYDTNRVIFSPEFLREGNALKDNLYPSRIILGSKLEAAKEFANSGPKKVIELFDAVKTMGIKLNGRVNSEVILLRAVR